MLRLSPGITWYRWIDEGLKTKKKKIQVVLIKRKAREKKNKRDGELRKQIINTKKKLMKILSYKKVDIKEFRKSN